MAAQRPTPRHEFTPHTAELALRVTAASPADLYAEACRALGRLFVQEVGAIAAHAAERNRRITMHAVDADALLVDLLNELIYLAETERWAPRTAEVVEWRGDAVTVAMTGTDLRGTPSRIKSATHHGLAVRRASQEWEAEVVFDV